MKHNKLIEAIRLILNGSGDIELVRDAVNLLLDELEDIEETLAEEEEYKELEEMAESFKKYREKKEWPDRIPMPDIPWTVPEGPTCGESTGDPTLRKQNGDTVSLPSGHTWDG